MYEDVSMFFLTGLPRTGTTWMRRMLDAHPQVSCKGEARLMTSPFVQGKGLWDMLEDAVRQWVVHEGSRKGNGFAEPEHEEIAWRQGSPLVSDDFILRETRKYSQVAARATIEYLLLQNRGNDSNIKAVGEKTPIIKYRDMDRFRKMDAKVIGMTRKFSEWLKSYHKHNLYRWETTFETKDFFPFTKDDYIRTVRAVRDHDYAPGQLITSTQISQAHEMYQKVNMELKGVASVLIRYEDLKTQPVMCLDAVFHKLGADVNAVYDIVRDHPASDEGRNGADSGSTTIEEYFREEHIIEKLRQIDQLENMYNGMV